MTARTSDWAEMMHAVRAFHDKYQLRENGGEELTYRIALMTEELGEISACISKGGNDAQLAEELADLLILLMGTEIASGTDVQQAFWNKIGKLMNRPSKMINGRIRVSDFHDVD